MLTKSVMVLMTGVCVALPLGLAWRVWRLDDSCRAGWLVIVTESFAYLSFILIVGRWDIAGYYSRAPLLILFIVAVLLSWRRHARRPWGTTTASPLWHTHRSHLLALLFAGVATAYVASGLVLRNAPRDFSFPLRGGAFIVGQGGSGSLLNYHYPHPQQRYAVDVLAINAAGFRAAGLLPRDVERYAVWESNVVAPCNGRVESTRDGLPDLMPPERDRDNPAGNNVVLDCGGIYVTLAHLREGSIAVQPGDELGAGDPIGLVGNSGNTSEPHLHVHAVDAKSGKGVQMTFDDVLPVRNRVFRRQ